MVEKEQIIARYSSSDELEKRNLALYRQLSGLNLAKEIANTKPELVVDLGCGGNVFKEHVPNLIGIDLVSHPNVDIVDDLHNAEFLLRRKADWILNFGPLQYTDPQPQVAMMSRMLNDHGTIVAHADPKKISFDEVWTLGERNGLRVSQVGDSYTDTSLMTPEDKAIQLKVCKKHNIPFDKFIQPRLTWRWQKKFIFELFC